MNIQIRHSDLPLALCEQRSNILVNVNDILTKTALENLKYMNIYNSLLRKKLCSPPSDPKMHCEPRGKLEMSTYPLGNIYLVRLQWMSEMKRDAVHRKLMKSKDALVDEDEFDPDD